jgi:hypothetical protein
MYTKSIDGIHMDSHNKKVYWFSKYTFFNNIFLVFENEVAFALIVKKATIEKLIILIFVLL